MATTVARAEIDVDADGTDVPRQVRRIAKQAGEAGAKEFDKAFGKGMKGAFDKALKDTEARFSSSRWENIFIKAGDRAGRALSSGFGRSLGDLDSNFSGVVDRINRDIDRVNFDSWTDDLGELKQVFPEIEGGFRRLAIEGGKNVEVWDGLLEDIGELKVVARDAGDSFDGFGDSMGRAGGDARGAGTDFVWIRGELEGLHRETERGRSIWQRWGDGLNRIHSRAMGFADLLRLMRGGIGGVNKDLEKQNNINRDGGSWWKNLSHNTRQWTLIIGAVAAALPTLAVLSSALSGTIVALGTALLGAAAGAGVLATAFFGLYDDTIKLSEGASASKQAFSDLGDTFKELQGGITNAVFSGMEDSIRNVIDAVGELAPTIEAFAGVAGEQLGRIFDALASPAGVENFKSLLEGFGPILENLTSFGISLGEALGNIFVLALPLAQEFTGAMAEVIGQFAAWTGTPEGMARINEFFDTARTVMPELMELVGATGQALANLVTPETIDITVRLLDTLTALMDPLSQFLVALGGFDVFGILAQVIGTVLAALEPLYPVLTQVGMAISGALISALQAIIPFLQVFAAAFEPIIAAIGPLVTAILPPLVQFIGVLVSVITPLVDLLAGVLAQILPIVGNLLAALIPIFSQILSAVVPLVQALVGMFAPVIEKIVGLVGELLAALAPLIAELVAQLMPAVLEVADAFLPLIQVVLDLVESVLPPMIETLILVLGAIKPLLPIIGAVANVIGAVLATAVKILTPILQVVIGVIQILYTAFQAIIQTIIRAAGVVIDFVSRTKILQTALNLVGTVVREVGNFFTDVFNNIRNAIQQVINAIQNVISWLRDAINTASDFVGGIGDAVGGFFGFASGGLVMGPTRALVGEAGPEAIVPLNRPLGAVDPEVRWLSAIAQGKATPGMARGGIVGGGGRSVTIAPGAVQVFDAGNARQTAYDVLDVLANRIAG